MPSSRPKTFKKKKETTAKKPIKKTVKKKASKKAVEDQVTPFVMDTPQVAQSLDREPVTTQTPAVSADPGIAQAGHNAEQTGQETIQPQVVVPVPGSEPAQKEIAVRLDEPAVTVSSENLDASASSTSSVPPFTPHFNTEQAIPKKRKTWLVVMVFVVLLLIIAGILIAYLYVSKKSRLPFLNNTVVQVKQVPVTEHPATPSPTPTVDLGAYSIQILNGSGKAGQAGIAQKFLEGQHFTIGAIGNANAYTYKDTVVETKKSVDVQFAQKLRDTLAQNYTVATKTAALQDTNIYDVVVIIGSLGAK